MHITNQTSRAEAFELGTQLQDDVAQYRDSRNRAGLRGAVEAARNWRRAASDHAETSYYGAAYIQAMRAYWVGVAFAIRRRDRGTPINSVTTMDADGTSWHHAPRP